MIIWVMLWLWVLFCAHITLQKCSCRLNDNCTPIVINQMLVLNISKPHENEPIVQHISEDERISTARNTTLMVCPAIPLDHPPRMTVDVNPSKDVRYLVHVVDRIASQMELIINNQERLLQKVLLQ